LQRLADYKKKRKKVLQRLADYKKKRKKARPGSEERL